MVAELVVRSARQDYLKEPIGDYSKENMQGDKVLPAEGEGKAEGELLPQGEGKYQEKDYYIQKAKNHQKGRYFVNEYYKENIEKEKKDQRKN